MLLNCSQASCLHDSAAFTSIRARSHVGFRLSVKRRKVIFFTTLSPLVISHQRVRVSRPGRTLVSVNTDMTKRSSVSDLYPSSCVWPNIHLRLEVFFQDDGSYNSTLQCDLPLLSDSSPPLCSPPHFAPPPPVLHPPALPFHITHMGELAQGSPSSCNPTHPTPHFFPQESEKINAQFSLSWRVGGVSWYEHSDNKAPACE